MKKRILLFGGLLIALTSVNTSIEANPGVVKPEINVEVNGQNFSSISSYLTKFVNLGSEAATFGAMGTSVVEFQVSTSGNISDFRVINSVSPAVDQEVIRVLKETNGKWKPGTKSGKPVSMKREASVIFKPNKNYNLISIAKKFGDKADEELLTKNDPSKAAKQYDKAVVLTPYDQILLAKRGLAKYEAGDVTGAKDDWNRIAYLNQYEPLKYRFSEKSLDPALRNLKGYTVMIGLLP